MPSFFTIMNATLPTLLGILTTSPAYAAECDFVMDCDVVALAELVRDNATTIEETKDKDGTSYTSYSIAPVVNGTTYSVVYRDKGTKNVIDNKDAIYIQRPFPDGKVRGFLDEGLVGFLYRDDNFLINGYWYEDTMVMNRVDVLTGEVIPTPSCQTVWREDMYKQMVNTVGKYLSEDSQSR